MLNVVFLQLKIVHVLSIFKSFSLHQVNYLEIISDT